MSRFLRAGRAAVGGLFLATLAAAGSRAPAIRLLFTGEALGYLEPCGCAGFKVGGAARRAALLGSLYGRGDCLYVDNGDLIEGADRQSQMKAETWAELLRDMRLDALNLGEAEWSLGIDYLLYVQQLCGAPFLCANVRGLDGEAVRSFTVVERAGRKVALVGALSGRFLEPVRAANPQLRFVNAHQALAEVKPLVAAELCVLLYHGPAAEAKDLVAQHPWIGVAVAAHQGEAPGKPQRVGKTLVVTPGQKGKTVGEVAVHVADGTLKPGEFRALELGQGIKESPQARAVLDGYLARLRAENLLDRVPRTELPGGLWYVGAATCARCHAKEHRIWQSTKHARAFQSLRKIRHEADPECVVCHVVGLNYASGFQDAERTPGLKDVGCESCHGPGSRHVTGSQKENPLFSSKDTCEACHAPDHSPRFNKASYWARIKH